MERLTEEEHLEQFLQSPPRAFGNAETRLDAIFVIRMIAGNSASKKTLEVLLHKLACNFEQLKRRIKDEGKIGHDELRDRLQSMSVGAREISKELGKQETLSRLIRAERLSGSCSATKVLVWQSVVDKIAHLAEVAAESIPKGKGRKRDEADGMSAKEMCARIVLDLWQHARGSSPSLQSEEVWNACEALWLAAGGEGKSARKRSPKRTRSGRQLATPLSKESAPSRWRAHLERAAKPPPDQPIGAALFPAEGGGVTVAEVLKVGRRPEDSRKKA